MSETKPAEPAIPEDLKELYLKSKLPWIRELIERIARLEAEKREAERHTGWCHRMMEQDEHQDMQLWNLVGGVVDRNMNIPLIDLVRRHIAEAKLESWNERGEADAEAICAACRSGHRPRDAGGRWTHSPNDVWTAQHACTASRIRALAKPEPEKEPQALGIGEKP